MDKKILDKAQKIKLIATDIDGVWTDSKMYYTEKGLFMKSFSTYDGMGASLAIKNNFIITMITSEYEHLNILQTRAKKLNIQEIYTNEHNKLDRLKYVTTKHNLSADNVAYIGDDINDIKIISKVGLSACPNDAVKDVKQRTDYLCKLNGGEGVFREFAELILKYQN